MHREVSQAPVDRLAAVPTRPDLQAEPSPTELPLQRRQRAVRRNLSADLPRLSENSWKGDIGSGFALPGSGRIGSGDGWHKTQRAARNKAVQQSYPALSAVFLVR